MVVVVRRRRRRLEDALDERQRLSPRRRSRSKSAVGELRAETTTEVAEVGAVVGTKTNPEAIRIKARAVVMVLTTSRRKVSKPPRFACINKKNREYIVSTIPSSVAVNGCIFHRYNIVFVIVFFKHE